MNPPHSTSPPQPLTLDLHRGVPRRLLSLDSTFDVVFKFLFEDEELLIGFLNRILHLQEGELITTLSYLERAQSPERLGHRGVIFDLLVSDQRGVSYEVELQRYDQGAQLSRALYYGARLLGSQLKESDHFDQLKPVRVILLTRFELFPDPHPARTLYPTPYLIGRDTQGLALAERTPFNEPFDLSHVRAYTTKKAFERRRQELAEMREMLSVTLVELTKDLSALTEPAQRCLKALSPQDALTPTQFKEAMMNSSSHTKRSTRLKYPPLPERELTPEEQEEQLVELPEGWPDDPWVRAFYSRLQRFAGDPDRVAEYNRAERDLRDHFTFLHFAETTGREEGYEVGRQKGLEAGRQEGLEAGRQEGLEAGRQEGLEARAQLLSLTIPSLLQAGKTPDEIVALLQLSPAERAEHLSEEP